MANPNPNKKGLLPPVKTGDKGRNPNGRKGKDGKGGLEKMSTILKKCGLKVEIITDEKNGETREIRRYDLLAEKLFQLGLNDGNLAAIKEIVERIEGKVVDVSQVTVDAKVNATVKTKLPTDPVKVREMLLKRIKGLRKK